MVPPNQWALVFLRFPAGRSSPHTQRFAQESGVVTRSYAYREGLAVFPGAFRNRAGPVLLKLFCRAPLDHCSRTPPASAAATRTTCCSTASDKRRQVHLPNFQTHPVWVTGGNCGNRARALLLRRIFGRSPLWWVVRLRLPPVLGSVALVVSGARLRPPLILGSVALVVSGARPASSTGSWVWPPPRRRPEGHRAATPQVHRTHSETCRCTQGMVTGVDLGW